MLSKLPWSPPQHPSKCPGGHQSLPLWNTSTNHFARFRVGNEGCSLPGSLSLSLFPSCSFKPITTYIYKLYLYRHTSVQYNAVYGCSLITKLVSLFWQLLCSWHNETCLGFIHSYMVALFYILSSTASFEMYLGVGQDMDTEIYCSKNESNTKKTHQKISDSGDYQTKNKTKKMLTSNGFLFVLYHSDISIMCNASQ